MKNIRHPLLLVLLSAGIALAACRAGRSTRAPSTGARPEIGSFGLDLAGMDRAVVPGDDFYDFANGTWVKRTEIPADRSRIASFSALDDVARARTRALVEEAAQDRSASGERKKIGDTFAAFMDEATTRSARPPWPRARTRS